MEPAQTITPFDSLATAIADLGEAGNRVLRIAITNNLATFPAQVPVFKKVTRSELQAKFAVLYFVRGWPLSEIANRYKLGRQRVGQIITRWRVRAVAKGYVQVIDETALIPFGELKELTGEAETYTQQCGATRYDRLTASETATENPDAPVASVQRQPDLVPLASWPVPRCEELLLLEELESIIGVLENQLNLRSKQKFAGAIDSCGQLFERAKALCALLAPNFNFDPSNGIRIRKGHDRRRVRKAIKTTMALIRGFQGNAGTMEMRKTRRARKVHEKIMPAVPEKQTSHVFQ